MLEPRILRLLLWQDMTEVLRSARGILFFTFFLIYWFWLFSLLADGEARALGTREAGLVLNWLFDARFTQTLFVDRDPTLSAVFFLALGSAPLFVIIAASDQTATDIGTRYMRFLLPCCQRHEIFVARFISAFILVCFAWALICAGAVILTAIAGTMRASSIPYAIQIYISLCLYSLPIIGLMSFFAAAIASTGLAMLAGVSAYMILAALGWYANAFKNDSIGWFAYILPSAFKSHLLGIGGKSAFSAFIAMPIYTAIFTALGWFTFSRRDV